MTTPKDAYDRDYKKANYDNILVRVKKGKREEYRQAAENFGLGQVEMIRFAIEEYIANHSAEPFTKPEKPESLSADERRLLEEFTRLPLDVQKCFLKTFKAINQNQAGVVVKPGDQTTPK